jgi:two-component system, NtrC family, sensor kinase
VHKLLERQLRKHFGEQHPDGAQFLNFVAAIDAAYTEHDADRTLLERSIELASSELCERNLQLERDLESIRRLELELRHAEKLRAVGQLAAGIAHEINTPIQYVGDSIHFTKDACKGLQQLGCELRDMVAQQREPAVALAQLAAIADEIELGYLLSELPKALEQIDDGVHRVAGIVSAMKDFGRPDLRDQSLEDVNHCLKNSLLVAQNELRYTADVEVSLGEIPLIPCYPGELSQVFLILLVNASHAIAARFKNEERGVVRVASRIEEERLVVTVSDNGSGIEVAHQCRIFEPFFTTKPVGVGTGQGLAIAHSIITEKHGGSLVFESAPGCGTTFRVSLPIHPRPPQFSQRASSDGVFLQ